MKSMMIKMMMNVELMMKMAVPNPSEKKWTERTSI
jgi:hypothetical protein